VEEGDVVLMGTDGIFDNLHDSEADFTCEVRSGEFCSGMTKHANQNDKRQITPTRNVHLSNQTC
jgi:hypothetical protein